MKQTHSKMRKVLRALDNKDLSFLTKMVSDHSVDPNKLIPGKGVSIFHLVIGHQSETFAFKVTKLFLRFGGDPNVPSEDGVTPIHVAAAWGRTRILHLLLVNGGDPWLQDDEKKNAFNYAFEEQEWDAVEMLHHFQQMHSAGTSKKDVENTPKFQLNFEKILLRKGQEMYEYGVSNDKNMKSTETQTHGEFPEIPKASCASPVLNKIKYFESHPVNSNDFWQKPDKSTFGWSKECYQTSCEFMVTSGENKSDEKVDISDNVVKEEKALSFVSSIHIDTSSLKREEPNSKDSAVILDKSSSHSLQKSYGDVRSQLFLELQEAVLRRSKLRVNESQDEKEPANERLLSKENHSPVVELKSSSQLSAVCIPNEMGKGNELTDPFAEKDVSYRCEINLTDSGLLKHVSDFASKVQEELKLSPSENGLENYERNNSNTGMTSMYLTCEEESDFKDDDNYIVRADLPLEEKAKGDSLIENSHDSFVSIAEEYKYTDDEEGVVLLEKKFLVTPSVSELLEQEDIVLESDKSSVVSDISSVPSAISYASDTLRSELTSFGFKPGPINKTTKKLYLKKLWKLKKGIKKICSVKKAYSQELEKTISKENNIDKILSYAPLEDEMMRTFDNHSNRKWREGVTKTSFNYLLLDPRITLNLPRKVGRMPDLDIWKCFLSSIFYVGKGKRTRPYAHLYEAVSYWRRNSDKTTSNGKIRYILDIWSDDLGVICLHVFQNIIPVEAYTREASMIDALGLPNLENVKRGEYYGSAATWTNKEKLRLGVYLLYKAMLIFLNEGERQIWPFDLS